VQCVCLTCVVEQATVSGVCLPCADMFHLRCHSSLPAEQTAVTCALCRSVMMDVMLPQSAMTGISFQFTWFCFSFADTDTVGAAPRCSSQNFDLAVVTHCSFQNS